jgi:hypothetical protein
MRSVGIVFIVWSGIAVVAYVGLYGAFSGTSLSVTSPDVLAALVTAPLLVAAYFWPPWGVFFVVVVTSPWVLETILAEDDPLRFWPVAVSLLVVDGYSIGLSWQRWENRRQAQARDAFEQLGRLAAEAPTMQDFADALQERGVDLVGEGRPRLWIMDRPRQELRDDAPRTGRVPSRRTHSDVDHAARRTAVTGSGHNFPAAKLVGFATAGDRVPGSQPFRLPFVLLSLTRPA